MLTCTFFVLIFVTDRVCTEYEYQMFFVNIYYIFFTCFFRLFSKQITLNETRDKLRETYKRVRDRYNVQPMKTI